MPQMNGEQFIQEVRKLDEDVQIVLQTGYSGEHPPRDMLRALAVQGYHDKSEGPDRLLLWVDVALKAAAVGIILAHNHPSGNLAVSREDIALSKRIFEAGQLLEILVIDHLIITKEGFTSINVETGFAS